MTKCSLFDKKYAYEIYNLRTYVELIIGTKFVWFLMCTFNSVHILTEFSRESVGRILCTYFFYKYIYIFLKISCNICRFFFLQIWRKDYFGALLVERNIPVIAIIEYFSGQNGRLLNIDISHRGLPVCQDTVQWISRTYEPDIVCVQPSV